MGVREGAGALTLAEVGKSRPLFVALCLHPGTEVALAFTLGAAGLAEAASATWHPEPAANSWPADLPWAFLQLGLASPSPGVL